MRIYLAISGSLHHASATLTRAILCAGWSQQNTTFTVLRPSALRSIVPVEEAIASKPTGRLKGFLEKLPGRPVGSNALPEGEGRLHISESQAGPICFCCLQGGSKLPSRRFKVNMSGILRKWTQVACSRANGHDGMFWCMHCKAQFAI